MTKTLIGKFYVKVNCDPEKLKRIIIDAFIEVKRQGV